MSIKQPVEFKIDVVGETSGERFIGVFKCKARLSHRDRLTMDKFKRDLLGPGAEQASEDSVVRAIMFSELKVRIVDAPPWWIGSAGGLDLEDDNVLSTVFNESRRIEIEALKEISDQGEKAKEALQEMPK